MITLVDSNVILDVATDDPTWGAWSLETLARVADESDLAINPLIFAEVSAGFATIEELAEVIPPEAFRRRGGRRSTPLADFYIGAHAAVGGLRLLTRDSRRYRTYFPGVPVIAPG